MDHVYQYALEKRDTANPDSLETRQLQTLFSVFLNFLEKLLLVEQYHAVNISSTRLDPDCVIGQQLVSHDHTVAFTSM